MPSTYDPRAIANEFIERNGGPLNQMQLQKLVYIAHGWHLAIARKPLTSDRIEAWDGGPVYRRIWDHFRDYGTSVPEKGKMVDPTTAKPILADLTKQQHDVIDHVWSKYGGYSGIELSEMTHEPGTPWSNAYFGRGRNKPLSQIDIQQHFIELALAGRTQSN